MHARCRPARVRNTAAVLAAAVFLAWDAAAADAEDHQAAVARLGKALNVHAHFARGLQEGVAHLLQKDAQAVPLVLACVRATHLESATLDEWHRIHARYLSAVEANEVSAYFESPGGSKLLGAIGACSTGPGLVAGCQPLDALSVEERAELAAFERTDAAKTLGRVQPLAQREWEGAAQVLLTQAAASCLNAWRRAGPRSGASPP
jgi:hypothetical protein